MITQSNFHFNILQNQCAWLMSLVRNILKGATKFLLLNVIKVYTEDLSPEFIFWSFMQRKIQDIQNTPELRSMNDVQYWHGVIYMRFCSLKLQIQIKFVCPWHDTTYSKLIDCYSSYWGRMSLKLTYKYTSWKIPDDGCCVTRSRHYHIVHRAHSKASHCICMAIQALFDTQLLVGIFPDSHHLRVHKTQK